MTAQGRPSPNRADWPRLVEAYQAGHAIRAIAAAHGVNESTVHSALNDAGVARRPPPGRRDWSGVLTREFLAGVRHLNHAEAAERAGMIDASSTATERRTAGGIVAGWRIAHGFGDPVSPAVRAQLHDLYVVEGLSIDGVAARLGIGSRAARRRLLAAGIELRPRGRPAT